MKPCVILAALTTTNAFGSLLLVGPVELGGTGFGTVDTVLTLQSPANTASETGCVAPSQTGPTTSNCGFADSNVQPGNAHIGTPTLSSAGVTSAIDLGIIFNADQPAGGGIQLENLVLNLYAEDGTKSADFSSGPVTFSTTVKGIGKSGFLFALDTTQAAVAQAFIDANGGLGGVSVGLGASLTQATGGPETFFLAAVPQIEPPAVPEGDTSALLGGGLVAIGLLFRQRTKSKK